MNIQLIGISHKTAPVQIRALFAFTDENKKELMTRICTQKEIRECVLLSTCNRTELYTVSEENISVRSVMTAMQRIMLDMAGIGDAGEVSEHLRFYQGTQAVRHLFYVAAGLDSMVLGEDQILGQVKEAHRTAMEDGFSGTWCNSLFRMAVTAAKKVKTETKLSGISVSTATLAVKAAEMYFGSLENRKILVIGATGKIGQIMMKNIAADHHVQLYAASRQLKSGEKAVLGTDTLSDGHGTRHQQTEEYVQIAYADRYRLANEMDVIISATASPHYTLTKEGWQSGVIQKRRRILIDMAVPMDIEAGIEDEENSLCHLDELTSLSEKNQHLRFEAADRAREMLEEDIDDFRRWALFQQNRPLMDTFREHLLADMAANPEKGLNKFFYRAREAAEPEQLEMFINMEGRNVIVIGGGSVALRKIRILIEYGADIWMISSKITDELKLLADKKYIVWTNENLTEHNLDYLAEAFLVICASDDKALNKMAADYCQMRHILVDCANPGEVSDCVFPSVVRRGNVVIGISTSGGVPALTRYLREKIEALIPEWYGELEIELRQKRRELKMSGLGQSDRKKYLRQWIAKEEKIREEGKGQYENRNEEEPSGYGADGNGGGGH